MPVINAVLVKIPPNAGNEAPYPRQDTIKPLGGRER